MIVSWENELYEMSCELAISLEAMLSGNDKSPTFSEDCQKAEEVLCAFLTRLKDEDLLPDELKDLKFERNHAMPNAHTYHALMADELVWLRKVNQDLLEALKGIARSDEPTALFNVLSKDEQKAFCVCATIARVAIFKVEGTTP